MHGHIYILILYDYCAVSVIQITKALSCFERTWVMCAHMDVWIKCWTRDQRSGVRFPIAIHM